MVGFDHWCWYNISLRNLYAASCFGEYFKDGRYVDIRSPLFTHGDPDVGYGMYIPWTMTALYLDIIGGITTLLFLLCK